MSPVLPQGCLDYVVVLSQILLFLRAVSKDFVQIWEPVIDNHSVLRSWHVIKKLREIWVSQRRQQRENQLALLQVLKIELKLKFFFLSLTDHFDRGSRGFLSYYLHLQHAFHIYIRDMMLSVLTEVFQCTHESLLSESMIIFFKSKFPFPCSLPCCLQEKYKAAFQSCQNSISSQSVLLYIYSFTYQTPYLCSYFYHTPLDCLQVLLILAELHKYILNRCLFDQCILYSIWPSAPWICLPFPPKVANLGMYLPCLDILSCVPTTQSTGQYSYSYNPICIWYHRTVPFLLVIRWTVYL